jgi:ribosomal protein S2
MTIISMKALLKAACIWAQDAQMAPRNETIFSPRQQHHIIDLRTVKALQTVYSIVDTVADGDRASVGTSAGRGRSGRSRASGEFLVQPLAGMGQTGALSARILELSA